MPVAPSQATLPLASGVDYTLESLTSTKISERSCALSEFIVNETHPEHTLILVPDEDEWGRRRIAAELRRQGSPFANEALKVRKRPSPIDSELGVVKWLLLEHLSVGEFCKHAKALGFMESGRQFGVNMRGRNSEFILSGKGFDCREDALMFSLVFKEGNQPAKTIVNEGVLQFAVYSIDLELAKLIASVIGEHRARISDLSPAHGSFLSEYLSEDVVRVLSLHVAPRASATREEKDSRSVAVARDSVFYVVQTVPTILSSAPDWFSREFEGYSKALERCWNSAAFKRDRSDALCHIAVGCVGVSDIPQASGLWVNISVFPVQSSVIRFPAILAMDLLTTAETSTIGSLLR
jgi:hypothetical protein